MLAVSTDGRRMCQGGYWEVEAVRLVMLPVGGGLVTDTEGVVAWFEDEDGGGVKGWVEPFAGC